MGRCGRRTKWVCEAGGDHGGDDLAPENGWRIRRFRDARYSLDGGTSIRVTRRAQRPLQTVRAPDSPPIRRSNWLRPKEAATDPATAASPLASQSRVLAHSESRPAFVCRRVCGPAAHVPRSRRTHWDLAETPPERYDSQRRVRFVQD